MLKTLKTLCAAAAFTLVASVGSAASLNLVTSGPLLTATSAEVEFIEDPFAPSFLFSGFPEFDGVSGITTDGLAAGFFDAELDATDPFAVIFGTLDISDDTGAVLVGDLVGFGFTDTSLEFLFDIIDGRFAADFGGQVLMEFTLAAGSGISFMSGLSDGNVVAGTLTVGGNVAPVPLPAGLPMLLAGLGGLLVLRRRQAR